MYRFIFSLTLLIIFNYVLGQEVKGTFYMFSNQGTVKMNINKTSLNASLYDIVHEKNVNVKYQYKEEYLHNGFIYICYNDVPYSRVVLKLKAEDDGYGMYTVNFDEDINKYSLWETSTIQEKIAKDTLNIRIGKLFDEKKYNKYLKLKDNLTISDEDFYTCVSEGLTDLQNIADKLPDKKNAEFWFNSQYQLGVSILSEQLIKLGYQPLFNIEDFFKTVGNNEQKIKLTKDLSSKSILFK